MSFIKVMSDIEQTAPVMALASARRAAHFDFELDNGQARRKATNCFVPYVSEVKKLWENATGQAMREELPTRDAVLS